MDLYQWLNGAPPEVRRSAHIEALNGVTIELFVSIDGKSSVIGTGEGDTVEAAFALAYAELVRCAEGATEAASGSR